jgi:hypothetical protein
MTEKGRLTLEILVPRKEDFGVLAYILFVMIRDLGRDLV